MNRSAERAFAIELKQTTQHIHSSADPMLVDSGEIIVEVSQAFLDLHGYDRAAELKRKPLSLVVGEGTVSAYWTSGTAGCEARPCQPSLSFGGCVRMECWWTWKPSSRSCRSVASPAS